VHRVTGARARRQRGSVLMLMPAAVLVLVILASIAVDFAIVGMRARELHNAAAAAANDAATAALSSEGLRAGQTWVDTAAAERVASRSLAARGLVLDAPPQVSVSLDGREVTVTLRASYDYVFAPAIPRAPDEFALTATATARAIVADDA
jgi:Flp pilus assembly protein TadG